MTRARHLTGATGKPTPKIRKIRMLVYANSHLLDFAGPLSLFATANEFAGGLVNGGPVYDVGLVAPEAGLLRSTGGIQLMATGSIARVIGDLDTLLVAGGAGVDRALEDRRLIGWLQRQSSVARRVASVCSGALLLAEAALHGGTLAVTQRQ